MIDAEHIQRAGQGAAVIQLHNDDNVAVARRPLGTRERSAATFAIDVGRGGRAIGCKRLRGLYGRDALHGISSERSFA